MSVNLFRGRSIGLLYICFIVFNVLLNGCSRSENRNIRRDTTLQHLQMAVREVSDYEEKHNFLPVGVEEFEFPSGIILSTNINRYETSSVVTPWDLPDGMTMGHNLANSHFLMVSSEIFEMEKGAYQFACDQDGHVYRIAVTDQINTVEHCQIKTD